MDQRSFEFPADDPLPRKRRRARARARSRPRKSTVANVPLTAAPILQRCGLCGLQQTVLSETAVCSGCGGIIVRQDHTEADGWVQPVDELPTDEAEEQDSE